MREVKHKNNFLTFNIYIFEVVNTFDDVLALPIIRSHLNRHLAENVGKIQNIKLTSIMKKIIFILILFFSNLIFSQTIKKEKALKQYEYNISLIRLISTPEKYHGQPIQVVGFLNLEFEGNAINLHQEDYEHRISRNEFWVDFSDKLRSNDLSKFNKRFVLIEGTFDMNSRGHMGLYGGTIKNITRIIEWSF